MARISAGDQSRIGVLVWMRRACAAGLNRQPEDNLMPRTKPLSDREINVLASAIGVIENQRLRSKIANDVWMTLGEYDKALTDGPHSARWFALSRADQMVDF
jgi:hypothetical protein